MTLDLYSYGRAQQPSSSSSLQSEHRPVFTCAGCGCSVVTAEPVLLGSLGWRILAADGEGLGGRALCPGCGRRSFGRRLF